jgi:hypothetical protein
MSEAFRGDDSLDVSLEDTALLDEVGLLAELIVAAQDSDGRLDDDAIDRVLGLPRH